MNKLESMKSSLFTKELSKEDLIRVNGGLANLTYTGCNRTGTECFDCSDTDDDPRSQLTSF